MRGYIALTDLDWLELFRARQPLEEVNLWQASGQSGAPLIFKLKATHNAIENGCIQYDKHWMVLALPGNDIDRPDSQLLRWHNDKILERGAA